MDFQIDFLNRTKKNNNKIKRKKGKENTSNASQLFFFVTSFLSNLAISISISNVTLRMEQ